MLLLSVLAPIQQDACLSCHALLSVPTGPVPHRPHFPPAPPSLTQTMNTSVWACCADLLCHVDLSLHADSVQQNMPVYLGTSESVSDSLTATSPGIHPNMSMLQCRSLHCHLYPCQPSPLLTPCHVPLLYTFATLLQGSLSGLYLSVSVLSHTANCCQGSDGLWVPICLPTTVG